MADKLSWTELRRAVAARAGVNEKTAGVFLNALTSQLLRGLRTDKMVKIIKKTFYGKDIDLKKIFFDLK